MKNNIESYVRAFSNLQDIKLDPEIEQKLDVEEIINNISCWDSKTAKQLVKSFAHLTVKLKDDIPYYDTIISDDASGRLISLFFKDVINKNKRKYNKEDTVSTYFLTPKRGRNKKVNKAIQEFIIEKSTEMEKVLVVTEHIDSGGSLRPIIKSLEEQEDIEFDIASISINKYFKLPEELEEKVKYVSKSSDGLIFHNSAFTGIKRNDEEKESIHPSKRGGDDTQKFLTQAREEISFLANEISNLI